VFALVAAICHWHIAIYIIRVPQRSKKADTQMGICFFATIVLIGFGRKSNNTTVCGNQ